MRRQILRHVSFVSATAYLSEGLYLLRGLILARLLGPATFGVWSGMRLVLVFSHYAQLGSRHGMIQLAPRADGAGDADLARQWRQTAAAVSFGGATLIAIALAIVAILWRPQGVTAWWLLLAALVLLANLFDFYLSLLKSQRRFGLSSVATVSFAALSVVLGVTAAWLAGLGGFLAAMACGYGLILVIFIARSRAMPRPRLTPGQAQQLVRIGLPIMLGQALFAMLWNMDKLWIWGWLGSESLGIYSIQAYFTNGLLMIPGAVVTVLHPHLMAWVGEQGEPDEPLDLAPKLDRGTAVLMQLSLPVIAAVHLLLHLPIRWWLPQFTDAIVPGRVLMLAVYLSMLGTVPAVVLTSMGRQKLVCGLRLLAVGLAAAAVGATVMRGGTFVHVAIAVTVCMGLYNLAIFVTAMRITGSTVRPWTPALLLPGLVAAAVVALAWYVVPEVKASWQGDLLRSTARAALVLAVLLPLSVNRLRPVLSPRE